MPRIAERCEGIFRSHSHRSGRRAVGRRRFKDCPECQCRFFVCRIGRRVVGWTRLVIEFCLGPSLTVSASNRSAHAAGPIPRRCERGILLSPYYHSLLSCPPAVVHPRGPVAGVCDHAADGANSSQETLILGSRGVQQKLRVNEGSR